MNWTDAYSGTVIWVSKDKTQIKIQTKGGIIKVNNEGFKIGDQVMFILDPASNKPLRILPKDIALLKIAMTQEPMHQLALITEDLPIIQEVEDDNEECIRHILEEDIDQSSSEPGEDAEEWYDFVGLTDPFGEPDWDHN